MQHIGNIGKIISRRVYHACMHVKLHVIWENYMPIHVDRIMHMYMHVKLHVNNLGKFYVRVNIILIHGP